MSHSRAVPSPLAVTALRPLLVTATSFTQPVWPSSTLQQEKDAKRQDARTHTQHHQRTDHTPPVRRMPATALGGHRVAPNNSALSGPCRACVQTGLVPQDPTCRNTPHQLVRAPVPHARGVVIAAGDDHRAIQAGHNRVEATRVALQHRSTVAGPRVPHTRSAVVGAGHQHVARPDKLQGV